LSPKVVNGQNTLVQATIVKKCDRTYHRPESNKSCANGACQHTCDPRQAQECAHKWTVRYSVNSRQREQSFAGLAEAQAFQLRLSAGKQADGALFTDPKAGNAVFLPLCDQFIGKMGKAGETSKRSYRSNFRNPEVTRLLQGKSVIQVAVMDEEVAHLLNVTLGRYSDDYRGNIRRIITGTLDSCVRKGVISRHTLSGIELGDQLISAEEYEARNRPLVFVPDEAVRVLADGISGIFPDQAGRYRMRDTAGVGIAAWLQRTMGLRIREALGVRKSDFKTRSDGSRYLHLCWQASRDGRTLEPLKDRKAGEFRDVPVPDMVWDMAQALPDGPLCPGISTPYMPYATAAGRFARLTSRLGISGVHTHSLRHQFASEALDADPRELANISQVLGHNSIETTLRFYIHASANAEQRIGAMMNARWTAGPAPAAPDEKGPRTLRVA
jgi:hypothetical protein